jgi:hypothetical protein
VKFVIVLALVIACGVVAASFAGASSKGAKPPSGAGIGAADGFLSGQQAFRPPASGNVAPGIGASVSATGR